MSIKHIEELEAKLNALKGQPIEEVGEELATTLNDLAYILYRSNPTKAEEYGRQALAIAEKLDDEEIIARSYLIIGIANIVRGNDGPGLEQSLRALSLYERIDDKPGIARCCNYIGYLHSKRGDHGKALEYLFQALELNEELDNKSNVAISYNTIGTIHHRNGDYANALKYLNKALALFEECGTENNKRNAYLDIGSVYYKQEKYRQALEYFQMALKLAETVDDKQSICICLHNLGDVNLQWKQYDSSLGYLEQSLAIALEIESREVQLLNYEFLSKLYEEQNEHKKALEYYQKYSELKSEVFSEESAERIAQLEIKHEVEKKEQQAEIYRLKNVELEAMVEERTERLAHLNAVLAAVRNVNQLITHEIDRDALLQQACEKLVEARGYFSAWITLLDDKNDIQADFKAGLTNGVGSSLATLKCGLLTLENPGILTVDPGDKLCQGCPRAYVEQGGIDVARLLTRLVYEGRSFGVICVTLPPEMAHDPDEQGLFEELAGDLSFALHHREIDSKRKESDRLYRSLYDSMSEGMSVNELLYERGRAVDYRVVDVNPAFEIIAKKQWSELVDKHATEIYGGSTVPFIEIMEDVVNRQKSTSFEMYYPRLKGHFHTSVVPLGGKTFATILTDVTERTKAEEALKTSETRFRSLVEQSSISTAIYDPLGKPVKINKAFEEMWGLKFEDLANYNILQDEQIKRQGVMPYIEQGFAGETATTPPVFYKAEDSFQGGFDRWVIGRIYPICDENNNIQNVVLMLEDITERKQAEDALQDSEAMMRAIFDSALDAIIAIDEEGMITHFNRAAEKMFGQSARDIIGGPLYPLMPEEFIAKHEVCVPSFFATGKPDAAIGMTNYEPARRSNGEIFPMEITLADGEHSRGKFVVGIARDITERKQAEEALRDSEAMMRAIFDAALDAIIAIDEDGMITHFNQAAEKMFDQSAKDIIGGPLDPLMPKEYIEKHHICVPSFFATGKPDAAIGMTIHEPARRSNGEIFPMEITLSDGEHSRGKFVVGVARDITERKQAEGELLFKTALLEEQSEASIDGILVVDQAGKVISVNERMREMWHFPDEIWATGNDEALIEYAVTQLKHPEEFLEKVKHLYSHQEEKSRDEIELKDGRFFDRYSSPLVDANGLYHGRVWYFRDITERRQTEDALEKNNYELGERAKELSCLYSISTLFEKPGILLPEILQGVVNLIPPAWQYPESTCARIKYEGKIYVTDNFKKTRWKQTANIVSKGKKIGSVVVCHLEARPEATEGTFLREERLLLNAIVERLGRITPHRQVEEEL